MAMSSAYKSELKTVYDPFVFLGLSFLQQPYFTTVVSFYIRAYISSNVWYHFCVNIEVFIKFMRCFAKPLLFIISKIHAAFLILLYSYD